MQRYTFYWKIEIFSSLIEKKIVSLHLYNIIRLFEDGGSYRHQFKAKFEYLYG